jgi:uncharacterized protein involved in high-affinity Fe2+ transport
MNATPNPHKEAQMPVNMKNILRYARVKKATPTPVPEPVEMAPVPEPVEMAPVEMAPVEMAPVEMAPVEMAPEWSMVNTKAELAAAAEAAGIDARANWKKSEILAALLA